jgi:elongation factor G
VAGRGRPWHIVAREREEHDHLVEDVVEQDDSLLARYLEGEQPTAGELERAMHDGVDRAVVFPVLLGSAVGPVAVDRLAEFICHVGPSPAEVPPAPAEAAGDVVEVPCDADGPPGWWPATSPRSRS